MFISLPDPEATLMTFRDACKEFELDCNLISETFSTQNPN